MSVRWTPRALDDLEAIELFLLRENPAAAEKVVDDLLAAGESLARLPRRGRFVPEIMGSGLRELVHGTYRIVYRIPRRRGPEVLTVFHARRTLPEDIR